MLLHNFMKISFFKQRSFLTKEFGFKAAMGSATQWADREVRWGLPDLLGRCDVLPQRPCSRHIRAMDTPVGPWSPRPGWVPEGTMTTSTNAPLWDVCCHKHLMTGSFFIAQSRRG